MCIRDSYMAMYEKRPPREITEIINFPISAEVKFNSTKFYNNAVERANKLRIKYKKLQPKVIKYEVGDRVLIKNRELPSTIEGIAKKLLLLYTGPYTVTNNNLNNTYELQDPITKRIKGTYNQTSMKRYIDN